MTRHDEPSKKAKTMNANIMKNPPPLLSQNYMNPRFQPKTSFRTHEKSLFLRQNDYWIIRYHGQTALLKSTRGLQYLAILLSDPGREFHVSELIAGTRNASTQAAGFVVNGRVTDKLYAGITMLDTQAKAEYKSHLNELRRDLDEAERFHDPVRQSQAQNEIHVITDRLASAVGFGGRDRKTSSDAERARSAVTKCIKKAVQKIGELNPSLGYHFAARIKTGYFCSYNPRPDRPAAWEVLPATSDFSTTFDFVTPKSHSVTPKVTP
jgi:non-specific serine/threonine protein kinase